MSKSKHTYRKYDTSYKQEVLRQVESGQSATEVARSLGISETLIYTWRAAEKKKQVGKVDNSTLVHELEQLRSKVKQLEMERDILKKAVSIFSRPT